MPSHRARCSTFADPDTSLMKSAQILESYFNYYQVTVPEPHIWLDLAKSLANSFAPEDIMAQPYLSMMIE